MKTLRLLIIFFILSQVKNCALDQCIREESSHNYLIKCDFNHLKNAIFSQNLSVFIDELINEKKLSLKLISFQNVKVLNSDRFNDLNELYSLDISQNDDKFESLKLTQKINSFKRLKILNMSFNRISIIKANQFDQLNELTHLDLSYNHLFYFEKSFAFNGLGNLIFLNLSRNKLTEIEENDLNNMPNIQFIYLDWNKLIRIRNQVFTQMKHLTQVSFSFNKIKTIDLDAFNGLETSLRNVSLRGNKLNEINSIKQLCLLNISDLDLYFNQISVSLFLNFSINLGSLDLAKNSLNSLKAYKLRSLLRNG